MTISGYTFVRNASKLAYPLRESILSIIDFVDEYVITYCSGDEDDTTLEIIKSINSDKIKIIDADWNPEIYKQNTLYSHLSDIAKKNCSGDWLFYLQVDEVVHEKYIEVIRNACNFYLEDNKIEGLLFNYRHFWGDYDHYFTHHGWYPKEIRVIRNLHEIHSWRDAQSFRFFSNFEPTTEHYQTKEGARKLNVALIPAEIFHYGWVRPPSTMSNKQHRMGKTWDSKRVDRKIIDYDYGPLNKVPQFMGTHPKVMKERISAMNWKGELQYDGDIRSGRALQKHEKLKYKLRTWIEINLLGGRELGGFKNYNLKKKYSANKPLI